GLRHRNVWLQARHRKRPAIRALHVHCALRIRWLPNVDALTLVPLLEGLEPGRHHSDHGRDDTLETKRFSQYIRVAVELLFPKGVADDDRLKQLVAFVRAKHSPQCRLHADHGEKVRRYCLDGYRTRLTGAGHRGLPDPSDRSNVVKNLVLLLPVSDLLERWHVIVIGVLFARGA